MRDIRPFAILRVDCRIKGIADVENAIGLSLFWKGRGVKEVFAAIHVDTSNIRRIAFYSGDSHGHARIGVAAAEPSAVTPRGVRMIVRSPRDRPDIAAGSGSHIRI